MQKKLMAAGAVLSAAVVGSTVALVLSPTASASVGVASPHGVFSTGTVPRVAGIGDLSAPGVATLNSQSNPLNVFIEGGGLAGGDTGFSLPVQDGKVSVPDDLSGVDHTVNVSLRKAGPDTVEVTTIPDAQTPELTFTVTVTQKGNVVQLSIGNAQLTVYGQQDTFRRR